MTEKIAKEPKVKKEKVAAPKVAKLIQNGIPRPATGKTARVWAIADKLSSTKNAPASRKEVLDAAAAEDINPATAATQYGRWSTFFGLTAKKAEAAAASDTTIE
jgi:hypothetical protein